jgi:hypothetical protein
VATVMTTCRGRKEGLVQLDGASDSTDANPINQDPSRATVDK